MPTTRRIVFALLLAAGALVFLVAAREAGISVSPHDAGKERAFVEVAGGRFVAGGEPFRFVGANVAVTYGEEERRRTAETLAGVRASGARVVRVWAHGEWDAASPARAPNDWLRAGAFRTGRDEWNEAAFVHLDRTLAEAARQGLRVQICLANWWRDTGGVAQYLAWAGRADAADASQPFGIDREAATEFYTDPEARRLYREHVRRIVARRNTVTGASYKDDPTIFAYELINEAQAPAGREGERRSWIDEMSRFVKSIDTRHLVTPGTWGYRTARERREWLADHALPAVDFCDVHLYPRDDADSFVTTPAELKEFVENREAAALELRKPLVFGEFGMTGDGFAGHTQAEWVRLFFTSTAEAGVGGALLWIVTPDAAREYGIGFVPRDEAVWDEMRRGALLFDSPPRPPRRLYDADAYRVPHTEVFARRAGGSDSDERAAPQGVEVTNGADGSRVIRFAPESRTRAEFERLGAGAGYVWGAGAGFFEYVAPAGKGKAWADEIVVRAHLRPVPPADAPEAMRASRVTLFVNDVDCGSRLITPADAAPSLQEWRVTSLRARLAIRFGRPLALRFAVEPDADLPFGLNISNVPDRAYAIEAEIR